MFPHFLDLPLKEKLFFLRLPLHCDKNCLILEGRDDVFVSRGEGLPGAELRPVSGELRGAAPAHRPLPDHYGLRLLEVRSFTAPKVFFNHKGLIV